MTRWNSRWEGSVVREHRCITSCITASDISCNPCGIVWIEEPLVSAPWMRSCKTKDGSAPCTKPRSVFWRWRSAIARPTADRGPPWTVKWCRTSYKTCCTPTIRITASPRTRQVPEMSCHLPNRSVIRSIRQLAHLPPSPGAAMSWSFLPTRPMEPRDRTTRMETGKGGGIRTHPWRRRPLLAPKRGAFEV